MLRTPRGVVLRATLRGVGGGAEGDRGKSGLKIDRKYVLLYYIIKNWKDNPLISQSRYIKCSDRLHKFPYILLS
jgi:hypothetical protein